MWRLHLSVGELISVTKPFFGFLCISMYTSLTNTSRVGVSFVKIGIVTFIL